MRTVFFSKGQGRNMQKCGILIMMSSLILIVLLGMGCLSTLQVSRPGEPLQSPTPGTTPIPPPKVTGYSASNPASVYITYPEFDGGIEAGNVTVTVQVRNFSLVNGAGRPVTPGKGHIMYFKDVAPRTEPGLPAETPPGTFQISYQTSCTWYNVTQGTHTFSVELVNNDNTPLVPAVIDAVDVTAVVQTG
jgi:LysM repeat protein